MSILALLRLFYQQFQTVVNNRATRSLITYPERNGD